MAETRWPGDTLKFCIQFAGRNVPVVERTTAAPTSITAMCIPPVEETEPGNEHAIAQVSVPKMVVETAAPAADATVSA